MLIVNLNQDSPKNHPYISSTLIQHIEIQLSQGKKCMLYLNKRGEYSALICKKCSFIFNCKNCDNALSIHSNYMVCHICNYKKHIETLCPKCKSSHIEKVGIGTEQIEKTLKILFPNKKIFRMDTDKIKNKTEKITALFEMKNSDIIIGTKMITTGFDFENIGLVGVILFEQELLGNRYDTEEKLYSNIQQLIGRGGRKGIETKYIIQTFIPNHSLLKIISQENYKQFFLHTLRERKNFSYPPFYEFVTLEYRHKNQEKSYTFTKKLYTKFLEESSTNNLQIIFSENSFKKYNQYYYKIIIKGENIRKFLQVYKQEILQNKQLSVIFS